MIFNLLSSVESSGNGGAQGSGGWIWLIILIPLVLMMVYNHFSGKKRREAEEKEKEKRNAIKPGFKVTTIGGIIGTVVAVDDDANTFVLETGTEENSCYMKFDKVAIYSSEDPNAKAEEPEEEIDDIVEESEIADDIANGEEEVEVAEAEEEAEAPVDEE